DRQNAPNCLDFGRFSHGCLIRSGLCRRNSSDNMIDNPILSMRTFKSIVLLGAVLSCLGGCLPSAGPASPGPSFSEDANVSGPTAQEMMVKTGPADAPEEGIKPKPDTESLGNENRQFWHAYYGEDATLIDGMAALTFGGGTTTLDLRVQRADGDPQVW